MKDLVKTKPSLKAEIMSAYVIMATKRKVDIERAIATLVDILNVDRDNIPALLVCLNPFTHKATAVAHMLLKQAPRARSQLKHIATLQYDPTYASEFEKSWLLLADLYIESNKFEQATKYLKDVLKYNKSCAKAWEYLGFIKEKESSYGEAAESYENAWKLQCETNPSMGFKLAFNYIKAHRYTGIKRICLFVDAIDVSKKVLSEFPEYPKIRKEILDKARGQLRMPVR